MQETGIIDQILGLFEDPLILIVTLWIIGIIIAVAIFRKSQSSKGPTKPTKQKTSKLKVKGHLMKQMQKMSSEAERDKDLTVPPVRSRQEIVSEMFESKTRAIGLEASTSIGHMPMSYTPLARFLKERNVAEDTVSAIIAGLMEEENEEDVKAIIEAAADSPGVNLFGPELNKAKMLAVEEWRNVKKPSET
ncbi:hypothetical protein E4H12_06550 [Candidatus Thorarchaeota archaeon]|nr:MAG: hypothetical protein E4H12_06550 [Candidatus Thorarchaeota archaeon]